jgi:hypothetical protein
MVLRISFSRRPVITRLNLVRDKFAGKRIGGAVGQRVAKIALPEFETGLAVALFP